MNTLRATIIFSCLVLASFLFITSCDLISSSNDENDVDTSLEFIPEVTKIDGASNVTLTVNRSSQSYFSIGLDQIQNTSILGNGSHEGWCIDYNKPIDSNGGVYENLQLYSSFQTKPWRKLNYFLNMKEDLKNDDPELTYREIQVIIWSLMPFPDFDLNTVNNEDIPNRMMTDEGERDFDEDKVLQIVEFIESTYENFTYEDGTKYAVVIETPSDIQTVITIAQ